MACSHNFVWIVFLVVIWISAAAGAAAAVVVVVVGVLTGVVEYFSPVIH